MSLETVGLPRSNPYQPQEFLISPTFVTLLSVRLYWGPTKVERSLFQSGSTSQSILGREASPKSRKISVVSSTCRRVSGKVPVTILRMKGTFYTYEKYKFE